jgi:hypothetical protein
MAGKRIYIVGTKEGVRLVKATVRQQALTHVANSLFEIRVASQDDLVDALGKGIKIEQYSAEQEELEFGV